MTRRIPHSQIYTFAVPLLKTLCRRSPIIGPWGLRAIQWTPNCLQACFPTPGKLGFPIFHLVILSHVVHSDIQQHLGANRHRGRMLGIVDFSYVAATVFLRNGYKPTDDRFSDTKSPARCLYQHSFASLISFKKKMSRFNIFQAPYSFLKQWRPGRFLVFQPSSSQTPQGGFRWEEEFLLFHWWDMLGKISLFWVCLWLMFLASAMWNGFALGMYLTILGHQP